MHRDVVDFMLFFVDAHFLMNLTLKVDARDSVRQGIRADFESGNEAFLPLSMIDVAIFAEGRVADMRGLCPDAVVVATLQTMVHVPACMLQMLIVADLALEGPVTVRAGDIRVPIRFTPVDAASAHYLALTEA